MTSSSLVSASVTVICILHIVELTAALKCYHCGSRQNQTTCPKQDDASLLLTCTDPIGRLKYTCARLNFCFKGKCRFSRRCHATDDEDNLLCNPEECHCLIDGCNGVQLDKIADMNGNETSGGSSAVIIPPINYTLLLVIVYFVVGNKIQDLSVLKAYM